MRKIIIRFCVILIVIIPIATYIVKNNLIQKLALKPKNKAGLIMTTRFKLEPDKNAKNNPEDIGAYMYIKGSKVPNTWFTYWNEQQELIYVSRPSGVFIYQNDGSYPLLKYVSEERLKAGINLSYRTLDGKSWDIFNDKWKIIEDPIKVAALASDSFNRTDGPIKDTDGKGHQESNSGSGLKWTAQYGDPVTKKNKAKFSSLKENIGIATVNTNSNDVYLRIKIYRSNGSAGLVWRYIDKDNYYRTYYDGTSIKTDVVYKGTLQNLFTNAQKYVDGQYLTVRIEGNHYGVFYGSIVDNVKLGLDDTLLYPIAAGQYGIYSTDIKNTFDDFVAFSEYLQDDPQGDPDKYLTLKQVDIVGDSLSARKTGYQKTLDSLLGDKFVIIDNGIPKATTTDIISRFTDLVSKHKPSYIVILSGINDIALDKPAEFVETNLQNLYFLAKMSGAKVIAVTLTPCNSFSIWNDSKKFNVTAVNNWIMNKSIGVDYKVDIFSALEDGQGNLAAQYDSGDHMHPNEAGNEVIGNLIYKSVPWQ